MRDATLDLPPPPPGVVRRAQAGLFATPAQAALSIGCMVAVAVLLPRVIDWAVLSAVWVPDANACAAADGACWGVVAENYRLILFGTYPYGEQWRALLASLVLVGSGIVSAIPRFWSAKLLALWAAAGAVALVLMHGGVFGLSAVRTNNWGGLPLTLLIFAGTVAGGLPLAVLLALGRRSNLPAIRTVSVALIETIRGVPLISVLFMVSLIIPLFLPPQLTIDKLLRALIGMIVFFAAYAAEVIRGGLQGVPHGQYEAAEALGLSYWRSMRKVILPQAFMNILPALMNDILRAFKNTTFVSIIGLFDILGATSAALVDPVWVRYTPEAYLFIFLLYFVCCLAISSYGRWLEQRLGRSRRI